MLARGKTIVSAERAKVACVEAFRPERNQPQLGDMWRPERVRERAHVRLWVWQEPVLMGK